MSTKVFISLIIIIGVVVGLANLYLLRDYWWGENADQSYAQQAQNLSTFSPPPMMDSDTLLEADVRDPFDEDSIDANIDSINQNENKTATDPIVNDKTHYNTLPKVKIIENKPKNTDINSENNQAESSNQNNTEIADSTNIDVSPESKSDFIQRYYRDLKNVPYEQTWAMLSSRFQSKHSLKKYINWWSKNVDTVFLEKVVSVKRKSITVRLQYKMKNGKKVCSRDTFDLIQSEQSWLLDKHRYRNCR